MLYILPARFLALCEEIRVKSPQTLSHLENVAFHSHRFVKYLHTCGVALDISPNIAYKCGIYHDLGKIVFFDIVNLDRKLTDEEFNQIKSHTSYGIEVAKNYKINNPRIIEAILYHHEDYCGDKGYLEKINGNKIPLIGRIIAIADVYEALYAKRTYKAAKPYSEVKKIMLNVEYKFDPILFRHFFDFMDDLILTEPNQSSVLVSNNRTGDGGSLKSDD